MKPFVLCVLLLFSSILVDAQTEDEEAVQQVIIQQQLSWNKGDIDGFMQGYLKSDSVMFVSVNGITYGWNAVLNNYKNAYKDTVAMGKLQLQLLELKPLSAEYYFVTGQWHLVRTIGDIGGYFTLLFRKINGRWSIIVDHTS